jgi:hypothetical protein
MSAGSLLLGATLVVLVALFLARPLLLSNARFGRQKSLRQELLAQKEAIMAQIQILEFDFETGTLPEEDYRQQRQQMVAEAAELLKKLDELSAIGNSAAPDNIDGEIEAAVARLRQRQPRPRPKTSTPAPVKAAPRPQNAAPTAVEAAVPTNGRVNFCSQCGQPIEEEDNFCAYCGHQILQPQTT